MKGGILSLALIVCLCILSFPALGAQVRSSKQVRVVPTSRRTLLFDDIISKVKDKSAAIATKAQNTVASVKDIAMPIVEKTASQVSNTASKAADATKEAANTVVDAVTTQIKDTIDWANNTAIPNVKEATDILVDFTKNQASSAADSIKEALITAYNQSKNGYTSAVSWGDVKLAPIIGYMTSNFSKDSGFTIVDVYRCAFTTIDFMSKIRALIVLKAKTTTTTVSNLITTTVNAGSHCEAIFNKYTGVNIDEKKQQITDYIKYSMKDTAADKVLNLDCAIDLFWPVMTTLLQVPSIIPEGIAGAILISEQAYSIYKEYVQNPRC